MESIWRQVIVVYRGGILALPTGAPFFCKLRFHLFAQALSVNKSFTEQEKENFDLSLIRSLGNGCDSLSR